MVGFADTHTFLGCLLLLCGSIIQSLPEMVVMDPDFGVGRVQWPPSSTSYC